MSNFLGTVLFSFIIGFSIYLSLPIVLRKKTGERTTHLLSSIAIGILIFLMCDIFSNVSTILYGSGALYGYGASPILSIAFAAALAFGFFMLYIFENRSTDGLTPIKLSLIIAIGIGLQNLTEGLVFGASSALTGLFSGVALVVLVGFVLQNMTEGFPIAAPLLSNKDRKLTTMIVLFLIGGLPTVIGGVIGFYYSSTLFSVIFDGLGLGAILYVILPMIKHQLRDMDHIKQRVIYAGIFLGFILGFLVNLI